MRINLSSYTHYIVNSIFILALSFILWNVGLWTAGDAKLFFVFNLLTPPGMIQLGYQGFFYGIVFFTNIFGLMLFFFMYKIIRNTNKRYFLKSTSELFKLDFLINISMFIFGFDFLFRFIRIPYENVFTSAILFFIIFQLLEILLKSKKKNFFIFLVVLRIIFDNHKLVSIRFLSNFITILAFVILIFLLVKLSYYGSTKKIKIDNLEEKMQLAEDIEYDESNRLYRKVRVENLTLISYLQNDVFKLGRYDKNKGLSKENIDWIKKKKSEIGIKTIRVFETMPFAPFIFVGIILTILAKGNVFIAILNFLI